MTKIRLIQVIYKNAGQNSHNPVEKSINQKENIVKIQVIQSKEQFTIIQKNAEQFTFISEVSITLAD
jgi:ABC-type oligopeptide transport system substrate-binding subunit